MRLLDLYSGAGGAALGYRRAGFHVVGVDRDPAQLAHYLGHEWIAQDVLDLDPEWIGDNFDAVHASPPCQAYSSARWSDDHPDLVAPTRDLLVASGLPYVIENVTGAPVRRDLLLCGSMFDMDVRRHRLFEFGGGLFVWGPPSCSHWRQDRVFTVTGNFGGRDDLVHHRPVRNRDHAADLMGMPRGLPKRAYTEAIPPAYTEWIAREVLVGVSR